MRILISSFWADKGEVIGSVVGTGILDKEDEDGNGQASKKRHLQTQQEEERWRTGLVRHDQHIQSSSRHQAIMTSRRRI